MATQKIITGNVQKIRVSATVVHGGNISGGAVTNAPGISILGASSDSSGSRVVVVSNYVTKPISGNAIARLVPGSYQIRRATDSAALRSGASKGHNDSIHHKFTVRTTRYLNPAGETGGFNYNTGVPLQGVPVSGSLDNFESGTAYRPAPYAGNNGEFSWQMGSNTPEQKDYPRKTG